MDTKINNSKILKKLNISKKKYFLVSLHRENTSLKKLIYLLNEIKYLSEYNKKQIIFFSLHPRTLKVLGSNIKKYKKFIFLNPFKYSDYILLQKILFV